MSSPSSPPQQWKNVKDSFLDEMCCNGRPAVSQTGPDAWIVELSSHDRAVRATFVVVEKPKADYPEHILRFLTYNRNNAEIEVGRATVDERYDFVALARFTAGRLYAYAEARHLEALPPKALPSSPAAAPASGTYIVLQPGDEVKYMERPPGGGRGIYIVNRPAADGASEPEKTD